MLASTWMDMVVGLDVHFEMVPTPAGPVPTPFPNPFIGMVIDPIGLATGLALGAAMALATGGTPTGPVLINFMPATNVGTEAKGMGHILIPPGAMWMPMPKFPKPSFRGPPDLPGLPVKPEDDAVSIMGSTTVTIMGSSAVRMGELWMSCGEPLRLPSSSVIAIPKGPPVLVGGPPGVNLLDALLGMIRTKWVAGYLHSLISRVKNDRLRNILHFGACFVTGHPIDVATGRMFTTAVDFEIEGPLPLKFERAYASSWSHRRGPLGPGWSHSLDQAMWFERGKVVYLAEDGREIEFDVFDFPEHTLQPGQEVYEPINQLTLRFRRSDLLEIERHDGETREFTPPRTGTGAKGGARDTWWRLARRRSRDGHEIVLTYDARGNLAWVSDSGGRVIAFEHDAQERLICVRLPHPDQDRLVEYVRYAYDADGDLVGVTDALGASTTFGYKRHLLVRETNKNGLSFYFAYDGWGSDAYCVRTWGDGGIYDHVLDYSKGKLTVVTNSLGQSRAYKLNPIGQVVEFVDARGASIKYEYDERSLKPTKVTDANGGVTSMAYDDRGNLLRLARPDQGEIELEYNQQRRVVRLSDAQGAEYRFAYNTDGNLVQRWFPDGSTTQYGYLGNRLASVVDAVGARTAFALDPAGNIAACSGPNDKTTYYSADRLGRIVSVTDVDGNVSRNQYDLLGQLVRVQRPDGHSCEFEHDAEGAVVRARDSHSDVRFEYRGMGRLVARSEAGSSVRFEYDSEEQLTGIINQQGYVYRFELDQGGQVVEEIGFAGLRRRFRRDPGGRVTRIERPGERFSTFTYDGADRVTVAEHSDGLRESWVYRPDGELLEATSGDSVVRFERDSNGLVLKEHQGPHFVASEYDASGERIRLYSSFGQDLHIARDALGDASRVTERTTGYDTRFARDSFGRQLVRSLPGGIKSRFQRDAGGRPVQHGVESAAGELCLVSHHWEPNERLRRTIDAQTGPIDYFHNPLGALEAAQHATGAVELRMPDEVQNLFRTSDRSDRKYGAAGELLEAETARGIVRYVYDPEGNLSEKREPDGRLWRYEWDGAGRLVKVIRPDGDEVTFTYDALGRRIAKSFRGQTTRWVWDGHVPLHEWVEGELLRPREPVPLGQVLSSDAEINKREAELLAHLSQGPPERGSAQAPITWLFEPETFAALAKLSGDQQLSIINDDLGTPLMMTNAEGLVAWRATSGLLGELLEVQGEGGRCACPFRWPGQYEDAETGLYYNRFRYYDPESGSYVSQDPIGLLGSLAFYAYVQDPLSEVDQLGLTARELARRMRGAGRAVPAGKTPHHIVQENAPGYPRLAEEILNRNGLDVNHPANGARLWGTNPSQLSRGGHPGPAAAIAQGTYHGGANQAPHVHSELNDKLIYRILAKAEKKGIPLDKVLEDIGRRMESGQWKKTAEGGCR